MPSDDSSETLPPGWTTHFEVLNSGPGVQCYTNSGTGQKFYSKADLMRYVTTQYPQLEEPEPESPPIVSPDEGSSDNNQMDLEYNGERPEWLPHGWTMELKARKNGRIKCYVDPSSGSKFYSKPQVLRHLKTVKQKSPTSKQSVVPGSKPDWLPDGWRVEMKTLKSGPSKGKTYKVYVESSTGSKFLAKPEVLRYLDSAKNQNSTSEQKSQPIQCTDEQPEWLPHGWSVAIKTKKSGSACGKKYKVFINPSSGRKFFTKPEVLRYLESVKNKSSTSKQNEMAMSIVATENSTLNDLPPGWVKEIKTRMSAGRKHKDPFYIDPVSGYVFRSKRDVHRYLETGDITTCAILPKKRNIEENSLVTSATPTSEELPPGWIKKFKVSRPGFTTRKDPFYVDPASGYEFLSKRDVHRYLESGDINSCAILPKKGGKSLPSSASKRRKLEHPVTSHQLLGENKSSDVGIMASPITVDKSSQRSPRDDDIESKENSDKNWSPVPKAEDFEKYEDKNMSALIKVEERHPTQSSSGKSKNQKWLSLPRRCSNRLAGFEPDMEINSLSIVQLSSEVDKKEGKSYGTKAQNISTKSKNELRKSVANSVVIVQSLPKTGRPPNGEATLALDLNEGVMAQAEPIKELAVHTSSDANNPLLGEPSIKSQGSEAKYSHPEADMTQENSLESVNEQRSQENNLRASTKKKEFNLPHRSSKRLASTEPAMKANSVSVPDGFADEAQAPKLIQPEHGLETPRPLHGEPLNQNQPFLDAHDGSKDKLQTVGKSDDMKSESEFQKVEICKRDEKKSDSEGVSKRDDKKKSESELIPPIGEIFSDPCLEFAFKTLTGELPVEMASVDGTVSTPASDIPGQRNLTLEKKENRSIKGKAPISSKKSRTTKSSLPNEALQSQSKPEATPIVKGRASKTGAPPNNSAVAPGASKTVAPPNNSAVAPDAQQSHHFNINVDKPEQPPVFTFSGYWSHPSLESTFKTVTGSLPVEDNIQGKSYLQKQAAPWGEGFLQQQSAISQPPKDVSATPPDNGFPSLFQTDVSVHSESPELRLSSQPPMPVKDNPFLSSGSLTFSSFSGKGGGFSSCRGNGFQPPPPTKNQPSPFSGGFSGFNGTGFQPPPPTKKNQTPPPAKKRGRPRKVPS
ncbi:hypothetical protein M5689_008052 [Euphorbia peplus]|nr:hypothetical protein M5689_008052 [Euphorbia peplus]